MSCVCIRCSSSTSFFSFSFTFKLPTFEGSCNAVSLSWGNRYEHLSTTFIKLFWLLLMTEPLAVSSASRDFWIAPALSPLEQRCTRVCFNRSSWAKPYSIVKPALSPSLSLDVCWWTSNERVSECLAHVKFTASLNLAQRDRVSLTQVSRGEKAGAAFWHEPSCLHVTVERIISASKRFLVTWACQVPRSPPGLGV